MGSFETTDHTADVGLRVEAESFRDLLATAARGAFSVMLEDLPEAAETASEVRVDLPEGLEGPEDLLVAWLQELLYTFESERLVPLALESLETGPDWAVGRVSWGRFDLDRHRTGAEVKGVTYHGLEVAEHEGGRWTARILLDI